MERFHKWEIWVADSFRISLKDNQLACGRDKFSVRYFAQSLDSIHYVIVLIYQYIFLDRNDGSKFYFLNKLSKAMAQKGNVKRKKKHCSS